jgi:hypothetical protein
MKLADVAPRYCVSCHNQDPTKRHVDFGAYYDGPVLEGVNGNKIAIDDLVMCETCVKAAGQFVGMTVELDILVENKELGEAVEKKNETIKKQNKMIQDLEHTVHELYNNPDKAIKKVQGRPSLRIPQEA